MKHFVSRWPNATYEELVHHYGAEPVAVKCPRLTSSKDLQNAIYDWLREQDMRGAFIGAIPGAQCWHIEGESNRLMFQLRWA